MIVAHVGQMRKLLVPKFLRECKELAPTSGQKHKAEFFLGPSYITPCLTTMGSYQGLVVIFSDYLISESLPTHYKNCRACQIVKKFP